MRIEITNKESINNVIKSMKNGDELYLKSGIYNEKVYITNENITITGESKESVIITNHDFYHKIMDDNNECNTFRTFTMYIGGNNVKLSNLTIENSSTPAKKYGQAVALHVDGNNFTCNNCIIKSAQDSLFTGPLPKNLIERYNGFLPSDLLKKTSSKQVYNKCTIIGDVDFIFGSATVLFNECDIISINNGYISAPSHYEETPYGYLFYKCNLKAINDQIKAYLARPWRDYGASAFISCNYGNHIYPIGFNKWEGTNRDKTARFYEYGNNNQSERADWSKQLTEAEAIEYYNNFINYLNNN